jgi:hypothetical protein
LTRLAAIYWAIGDVPVFQVARADFVVDTGDKIR